MHQIDGMTLFFGADDALSNWHPCQFQFRGLQFTSVEQFMMYAKAMLFGDRRAAAAILATDDPRTQKRIGRLVNGFQESVWLAKRESIVTVGCREKFRQNPRLAEELIATSGTVLVEASPYDRIWGVWLAWNDPRILDSSRWRGMNLLGNALMRVRDDSNVADSRNREART
ncbi:GTP cyclohydrolase (plasmid) [Cupriavidus sp. USMAHM13]|uniref:NADAR family protein n=1 Tax=Cupriavidus sp. USMAHM13 TaxID=1389192 RepID=UPI0008A68FD0|nr:NADAR family protein [Cupriavidus sp. USMAHM13]AOZ04200.1 GTP cyclohydrolase [Cupriavidus sp. USMAHM13]